MTRFGWLALLVVTAAAASLARGPDAHATPKDHDISWLEPVPEPAPKPEPGPTPLRCFQMTGPVLTPGGLFVGTGKVGEAPKKYESRQTRLVEHVFANSYEHPFVSRYQPPHDFDFGRVVLNLTVVSEGRQYDRLASLWLGDVEIWRTSTAEPKARPGIVWTQWKDVTNFDVLWRRPQTLILDLGNLVTDKLTGSFNVTLTATFFNERLPYIVGPPADEIMGVSAGRTAQGRGSAWTLPDERAETTVSLPRHMRRAVMTVAATGQADDEFWWSNVPNAGVDTFGHAGVTLPGRGSFREVRVWIDGFLVGLAWPFPVVFTGGIAPPLHRPLVGPQAFDMREYEIDLTPWVGLLANGRLHNVTMRVVAEDDADAPRFWLLSAKIFLWLDPSGAPAAGSRPAVAMSLPNYKPNVVIFRNKILKYHQLARRELRVTSRVRLQGQMFDVVWTQNMTFKNMGTVQDDGRAQEVSAAYHGEDALNRDLVPIYFGAWTYPIQTSYVSKPPDDEYSLRIEANLTHGEERVLIGETVFPNGLEPFIYKLSERRAGADFQTMRSGEASFFQRKDGTGSSGWGSVQQEYSLGARDFSGVEDPNISPNPLVYRHEAVVVNETVVHDKHFVYRPDMKVPVREAAPWPAGEGGAGDAFAPVLTTGRGGGSRLFPGKYSALGEGPEKEAEAGHVQL